MEHHARRHRVVIISIYARTWSSRLLRAIGERLELLESNVIRSGHLAWTVAAIGRSERLAGCVHEQRSQALLQVPLNLLPRPLP